jgi:acetylornithine/succinyldiaminopimelate/putrescine aminotransferase
MGLMVGVALKTDGAPVVRAMAERGVLANAASLTVIRLVPPLVITKEELSRTVDVLREVLDGISPD